MLLYRLPVLPADSAVAEGWQGAAAAGELTARSFGWALQGGSAVPEVQPVHGPSPV